MSDAAGIFPGMFQYPDQQKVIDDLGDKFLLAFVKAVEIARDDLAAFEQFRPHWFINFSKRFVANFIHERMWDGMTRQLFDYPDVVIVDNEPTRQVHIGSNYVVRFKRHSSALKIESFPTPGALAFWTNRATLPGLELMSLAMGYIWNPDTGEIGEALLSFRDGKDNPVWSVKLNRNGGESATDITWSPVPPELPQLDLSEIVDDQQSSTDEGS